MYFIDSSKVCFQRDNLVTKDFPNCKNMVKEIGGLVVKWRVFEVGLNEVLVNSQ